MPTDIVNFRRGWMAHPGFANDYEKLVYASLVEQAAIAPGNVDVDGETVRLERGELPITARDLAVFFTGSVQPTARYESLLRRFVAGGLISIRQATTERRARLIPVAKIVDFVG